MKGRYENDNVTLASDDDGYVILCFELRFQVGTKVEIRRLERRLV